MRVRLRELRRAVLRLVTEAGAEYDDRVASGESQEDAIIAAALEDAPAMLSSGEGDVDDIVATLADRYSDMGLAIGIPGDVLLGIVEAAVMTLVEEDAGGPFM